jgi:hypothetical protein
MFPDHLAPSLLLGEIYYLQGDREAARKALRRCVERRTRVQSADVARIADDARRLWNRLFPRERMR